MKNLPNLRTVILLAVLFVSSIHFAGNSDALPADLDNKIILNHSFLFPDSTGEETDSVTVDSSNVVLSDSILAVRDSIRIADSVRADSSARIRHFKHSRKDVPYTTLSKIRKSSFFTYPSESVLRREVSLDSTGQFVVITQYVGKIKIKNPLKIPIEEYISLKLADVNDDIWEDLAYDYELKNTNEDLSEFLTDLTNIEIPLPSSSILSIFGPPEIRLKIRGAVDIHGAWRSETTEGVTASLLGNTRNEPDFKQEVQINVDGTIGDKLTIGADWNTERTFEYENQLKLKYQGYEDEIIQSIEAGNVSLQTSPLVGGSEALFGIKANFQMGPFTLTALASQKKGEVEEISVSGGAKSQPFDFRAYDYSENHYFLDTLYASEQLGIFNEVFSPAPDLTGISQYEVVEIEVYKTVPGITTSEEIRANAFLNLPQLPEGQLYPESYRNINQNQVDSLNVINGRFELLEEDVDYSVNESAGFISFRTQVQNDEYIAVAYRVQNGAGSDDDGFYGEFNRFIQNTNDSVRVLKLVKPKYLNPQLGTAWKLQLKNIYPIGGRNVQQDGFKLDIYYETEGQDPQNTLEGINLIEAFGLDRTSSGGSTVPDGEFDFAPQRSIYPNTGEIIFPVLEPFGKDFPVELDQTLKYEEIYTQTKTEARKEGTKDKFVVEGEFSASVTSVYPIGFNVVENSVRVTLNGRELVEGRDYTVDYNIGQVIIRNDDALVPGANLNITYEQNDLFQLASKTLLGFRGILNISDETNLGFSFLNLNQQTLSEKVRIGEEPLNNSIFGIDFNSKLDLPFITNGLDNFISTNAPSSLTLRGEFAYMNPDPNSKKSSIRSDDGKSIAYVDDFEGSKRLIPLGISYTGWRDISPPAKMPYDTLGQLSKDSLMSFKAKSFWFNILPSNVRIEDIYSDRKQAAREDEYITVLDYVFRPNSKGSYNYTPDLTNPSKSWGGFMKPLSSSASNLEEENIQFVEFWLKIEDAPDSAKLFIDLGQISEDITDFGKFNNEDLNQNDLIDEGEDTGLDGLLDTEEPGYNGSTNSDPSGDNFVFQRGASSYLDDYANINGTQGNASLTDVGRFPDNEDMNRNLSLDNINSFFRYEVSLDTNSANNELIAGSSGKAASDNWYLFRVPINEYTDVIGSPTFTLVEHIRFWTTGNNQDVHLRFAEMNLVGNQWEKVLRDSSSVTGPVTEDDEVLTVSTISIEDNPEYFIPADIPREIDRTSTTTDEQFQKNEQSLLLELRDLQDGDNREVIKYLFRPLDVFNYKQMKYYIHGDDDEMNGSVSYYEPIPSTQDTAFSTYIYLRFGTDTSNYYEYRAPVRAGWNQVEIEFKEMTALKQVRPFIDQLYRQRVPDKSGHTIGVKGEPTLTKIKVLKFGIENPQATASNNELNGSVTGDIWLNELRVVDVDNTPGWAYKAETSLRLADLMTINYNSSQTDPYFHKLSQRFGSRLDEKNWSMSVSLNAIKLIPLQLPGSSFNISYQRSESLSDPLYLPGTDIDLSEAIEQQRLALTDSLGEEAASNEANRLRFESQTFSQSETWNLSNINFVIPTEDWWIRDTFNKLNFSFNYNKRFSRNPTTVRNESWSWAAGMGYQVNFSRDLSLKFSEIPYLGEIFKLFDDYRDYKIYFAPNSFQASVNANRRWSYALARGDNIDPKISRDFTADRRYTIDWKVTEGGLFNPSLSYNINVRSSLTHLLLTEDGVPREESEIFSEIFGGAFFGNDYDYAQSVDLKTSPKLPTWFDIDRFFQLTAGYSVNYNWRNDFNQPELGRSAGYSNNLRLGLSVKVKNLFEPLFEESADAKKTNNTNENKQKNKQVSQGGRDIDAEIAGDKNQPKKDDNKNEDETDDEEIVEDSGESTLTAALNGLKSLAKYVFFDYDNISLDYNQTNSMAGGGLKAPGTGYWNFWTFSQEDYDGPSRGFMLGLSKDLGPRVSNAILKDNYRQTNQIKLSTSRPLWEGATINLNWNVNWGINKTTSFNTLPDGSILINNITSTGTIDRSFLSLPPVLIFSVFDNGIKKVNELYDKESENPNENLSKAFTQGFETFPILSNLPFLSELGRYIPRPNWSLNWSGLEKIPLLSFAQRATVSHNYSSSYTEGWLITPGGDEEVSTQRINYNFSPLIGLSMTFQSILDGNLTGSFRYNSQTSYDLSVTNRNITENSSQEISLQMNFKKSGFELPLFGISLKNDLEFSFTYSRAKDASVLFEMDEFRDEGIPKNGKTRTSWEPRVKYVMSSRVTLSFFYKQTSIEPEGAARIPPTTTNEAGLDVNIAIQ